MGSVACETDDRGTGPGKRSFNAGADEAAIFSHALEITHGGGAAGADPAGKAAGVAFGFRVGQGNDAGLGESGFEGQRAGANGVESGGSVPGGVQGRVWVWMRHGTCRMPAAYTLLLFICERRKRKTHRPARSGFWQGTISPCIFKHIARRAVWPRVCNKNSGGVGAQSSEPQGRGNAQGR
jgi:hypothetical protein